MMEQKCFKLGEILYRSSDATCDYELLFTKLCTLRQFMKEVISNKKTWGYIGIQPKDKETIFGDPCIEYRNGLLLSTFPDELLDKQIDIEAKHKASGGWSRMDYLIRLVNEK